jgi:hypothetical protein
MTIYTIWKTIPTMQAVAGHSKLIHASHSHCFFVCQWPWSFKPSTKHLLVFVHAHFKGTQSTETRSVSTGCLPKEWPVLRIHADLQFICMTDILSDPCWITINKWFPGIMMHKIIVVDQWSHYLAHKSDHLWFLYLGNFDLDFMTLQMATFKI